MEFDDAVEQMFTNPAKLSVYRGGCAFDERPGFGLISRDVRMCMMKVGYGYDPVVEPKVRNEVEEEHC